LITLAVLLASIWTGMTLARRITEPIAALADSTRRLRSGDFSSRVDVAANDELGVLVDSFNSMAAGLQQARDDTLRSNQELQEINRRPELGPLVSLVEEAGSGTVPASPRELILPGPGGERRLEIALRPLSSASDRAGWVVAVEDTTHVAREQKLAAWSEVARRVAHE